MITHGCIETVLPVVADSWDRLRACDVYRLLDQIAYETPESLAIAGGAVVAHRPDLFDAVAEAVDDLKRESFGLEATP